MRNFTCVFMSIVTMIGSAFGLVYGQVTKPKPEEDTYIAEIVYDDVWRIPYRMTQEEWEGICAAVMSEAEGEGLDGQMFVANCMINKCRLSGKKPLEVIRDDTYSRRCDYYNESVEHAVEAVFFGDQRPWGNYVTIFYAPKLMPNGTSAYHEGQVYCCTVGNHKGFIENQYAEAAREAGEI